MKGTIFLVSICLSISYYKLKEHNTSGPELLKVQTYTQRTYPEGHCSDGIAKFYIGPQRLTIVHYHNQSDNAYGTFCYTVRWAGEYFIARQKDTIAQVTMDSALVFPRCCPLKYRK